MRLLENTRLRICEVMVEAMVEGDGGGEEDGHEGACEVIIK